MGTTMTALRHQNLYMQSPFLYTNSSYFFLSGGYGCGKTRSNAFLTMYIIKLLQNKKDAAGDYARVIVAGFTLSHLNKTLLPYIRQMLDSSKTKYTENKKDNIFQIGTVTVIVVPLENPENIFGYDAACAVVEEIDELPEDKSIEAVRALRERCRQRVKGFREPFLAFGSTSQGLKGLYRIYAHFKKSGVGFVLIKGKTEDNPYLPKSQIREMKAMYTHEEYLTYMCGEFLNVASGKVFPDFDWERNTCEADLDRALFEGETVYAALDINSGSGFNRGTAFVVRSGVVYGIKRYDFPKLEDVAKVLRYDYPTQRIFFIPDATAKDMFRQFYADLRKYKIMICYRKKSPLVEDCVFLVNRLLIQKRLIFCPMARESAEAMAIAARDKNGQIPKGIGPSSPIHDVDAVRYACAYICARVSDFRDLRTNVMSKRPSFKMDNDERPYYAGDGYMVAPPGTFKPEYNSVN